MKKILLTLALLMVASISQAQCVADFKMEIDPIFGSIKVTTQYKINGQAVDVEGKPCDNCSQTSGRYDSLQGTWEEIFKLSEEDRNTHCEYLINASLTQAQKDEIKTKKIEEKIKQNLKMIDLLKPKEQTSVSKTIKEENYKNLKITTDTDKNITYEEIVK